MTSATVGYSAISSYSRVEILRLLGERPQRTIADLSAETGLHANTVREHLQRLEDEGCVIRSTEKRTTRGRPRVLFSAIIGADASSPVTARRARDAAARGDLMRRILPDAQESTEGLEAAAVHQLDAIIDHLDEAGFEPEFDGTSLTLDVTPCMHQSVQADHRETLCAIHLGIMQGVLAQAGGPLHATEVRTEGMANGCVVQLARMTTKD
ncbi:transcriptional regulator [Microbacterium sp. Root61]|uniref:helix-turn-helix transcriptional regulator n=1 Tax=Microbacterium sp. Root61 TaxID=1736570 RepID=UPI0006F8D555|nr:helix-turn-helix domain-containing protein [Microbacterium sp. Root61]KRA24214.1 transcriptional regulator [Microbacterium sp. Root61]